MCVYVYVCVCVCMFYVCVVVFPTSLFRCFVDDLLFRCFAVSSLSCYRFTGLFSILGIDMSINTTPSGPFVFPPPKDIFGVGVYHNTNKGPETKVTN